MAKRRRSFGKKKADANRKIFVGRKEQVQQFENNLKVGPDSDSFFNIFNIYGQSGVGKTTLVERYQNLATTAGYHTVRVDTEEVRLYEVIATMNAIAEELEKQNAPFKKFSKNYKVYLQEKGKLEANPDRPKGVLGKLVKASIKTSAKIGADLTPGGNAIIEYVPTDTLADAAGDWADWVAQTMSNKDEVELVLYPIRVLTPLWLEDLYDQADKKHIALFFDTYETANPELDKWLLDLLEEIYGNLPDNLILSISGQAELNPVYWNAYKENTVKIPLDPFTHEEAKIYLEKQGVTKPHLVDKILAISNCLPAYLTLLVKDDLSNPDDISDPNEKIVERFLRHIKEPMQRQLVLRAALPRKFNKDVIACLLPKDADAMEMFSWLKSRPFVEKRGGYWTYHSVVKEIMLSHQKEISEVDWETTHINLSEWYQERATRLQTDSEQDKWYEDENWRLLMVENHFHLLCANYKNQIPRFMRDVVVLLYKGNYAHISPFANSLIEVEKIYKDYTWGNQLNTFVSALIVEEYEEILSFLKKINAYNWIEAPVYKSFLFYGQGCYENEYRDSLLCYDKAIELNPKYALAYYNRGIVLNKLERQEEALDSFDKAIELNPKDALAYYNRGTVLGELERQEEALDSFDKAIKLNPKYALAYYNRGTVLGELGRQEEALDSYDKAIELNPKDASAYYNRGTVLGELERQEEALDSYDKAIELNPKDANAWHSKGWLYLLQHQLKEAKKALLKAWELSTKEHNTAPMNLGHIELLQNNQQRAIEWYQKSILLWEDRNVFFRGMKADYQELKMQSQGITPEAYQSIIILLKKEI